MSIDLAISACGSAVELARRCGVSVQRVSNWRQRGVPADQVLKVAAATGWSVTPNQINPTLYPYATDGLPPELRGEAA